MPLKSSLEKRKQILFMYLKDISIPSNKKNTVRKGQSAFKKKSLLFSRNTAVDQIPYTEI